MDADRSENLAASVLEMSNNVKKVMENCAMVYYKQFFDREKLIDQLETWVDMSKGKVQ